MKFVIEYYAEDLKAYIPHSSHTSYKEAKREMNAGWSLNRTRRLKVVDERVICKVKFNKYMVDSEDVKRKPIKPFK